MKAETLVSGYETAGSFRVDLVYNATEDNIERLIESFDSCKQFLSWRCKAAVIHNPHNPDHVMTWWADR